MKVFISYRRASLAAAARVYDALRRRYAPQNVFMDVASDRQAPLLAPGVDFREELRRHISAADVLICIISDPKHLTPRAGDEQDFLHYELSEALSRKVKIVPVLVEGATMPDSRELPESIRPVAFLQAVELTHSRFDSDVDRLFDAISGPRFRLSRTTRVVAAGLAVLLAGAVWWAVSLVTRVQPYRGDLGEVVLDRSNGLMWSKVPSDDTNWEGGGKSCQTMRLGGYTDWRLPSNKELIVAHGLAGVWSQLSLQGLRGLWTSSAEGERHVWVVYSTGDTETLPKTDTEGLRAVCVRPFRDAELVR